MKKKIKIRGCLVSFSLWFIFSFGWFSAAVHADIVVEIPGIMGDSDFGVLDGNITASKAGGSFEKGDCGDFVVEKGIDIASPLLIRDTVNGTTYAEVRINYLADFGGDSTSDIAVFLELTLANAIIRSLSVVGNTDTTEVVTFAAELVRVKFTPYDEDGGAGTPIVEIVSCGHRPVR